MVSPLTGELALIEVWGKRDFVNPGLLDTYAVFKRLHENPIVKSRQPGASAKDVEKGKARGEELARLTGLFVLRRTAEILSAYLPPKSRCSLVRVMVCADTK